MDVRWGLDFDGEQVVQLSPDVNLKRGVNLQPLREWHERDPIFALLGLTSLSPVDFVFKDVVKDEDDEWNVLLWDAFDS